MGCLTTSGKQTKCQCKPTKQLISQISLYPKCIIALQNVWNVNMQQISKCWQVQQLRIFNCFLVIFFNMACCPLDVLAYMNLIFGDARLKEEKLHICTNRQFHQHHPHTTFTNIHCCLHGHSKIYILGFHGRSPHWIG